ncbi:hypothetical protein BKA70DRAFT_1307575 [Coprinopsis sp. MPI-PUGE-AT-0042]|nr:hypothetical protein BKA70DRAFT_1307575 [Coprinopsis sp. MPI-PUGE-AT-0042]
MRILSLAILPVLFVCCISQRFLVTSTGVIGTGCPLGTAAVDVNDSTRKVTVRADSFRAQAGRGIGISENRKACRVMLGVDIPEGHSFAFDRASSGVSYSADGGVLLSVTSLSYFQGSLEQSQGLSTIPGPTRGSANLTSRLTPAQWSPCGGSAVVILGSDLRVNGSASARSAGSIESRLWESSFLWRVC